MHYHSENRHIFRKDVREIFVRNLKNKNLKKVTITDILLCKEKVGIKIKVVRLFNFRSFTL
jgi:hypothetical protein